MRASCSSADRAQMRGRFEMMIMKSRKIHIYRAKEGMYFWRWNRMEGGVYGQSPDHGTSTLHTNLLAALRFMCFLCGPKHFLQYNCCLHCWEFVECRVCFTCFTLGFPCSITIKPYKKNANWLSLLCANSEKHLLMRHIMTVRLLWTFVASHIRSKSPHAFANWLHVGKMQFWQDGASWHRAQDTIRFLNEEKVTISENPVLSLDRLESDREPLQSTWAFFMSKNDLQL